MGRIPERQKLGVCSAVVMDADILVTHAFSRSAYALWTSFRLMMGL